MLSWPVVVYSYYKLTLIAYLSPYLGLESFPISIGTFTNQTLEQCGIGVSNLLLPFHQEFASFDHRHMPIDKPKVDVDCSFDLIATDY